jgi:hypothetical protein
MAREQPGVWHGVGGSGWVWQWQWWLGGSGSGSGWVAGWWWFLNERNRSSIEQVRVFFVCGTFAMAVAVAVAWWQCGSVAGWQWMGGSVAVVFKWSESEHY